MEKTRDMQTRLMLMRQDYALEGPRTEMNYRWIYHSWTELPKARFGVREDEETTMEFISYALKNYTLPRPNRTRKITGEYMKAPLSG
jgi:hypothetical protein